MPTSMRQRFGEVDRIPCRWDMPAAAEPAPRVEPRSGRRHVVAVAVAAVLTAAIVVAVAPGPDRSEGELPDASWLTGVEQASCVEPYSPRALAEREWAFEGVITAVDAPDGGEEAVGTGTTTVVTFRVDRWFWGGSGDEASRETFAVASSAGVLEASIGARVLASGDAGFLWACGFTQPASDEGRSAFEDAAARRGDG